MNRSRSRSVGLMLVGSLLGTLTLGLALGQDRPGDPKAPQAKEKERPKGDAKKGDAKKKKGPAVAAGAPPKKNRPNGADPLNKAKAAEAKAAANAPAPEPPWPFSFKLKIEGGDGYPIAASYYPPKTRFNAPVILLVHDKGNGRSAKDWQEPLAELKGLSLAESLQEQGYAVLVPDLRGHGQNARKELSPQEWRALPADLQALYLFLVDRHNRGDFNLGKLGVIAVGESANLVAAWSSMPGAAVSSEGRVGDLSAMIMISPVENSEGLRLLQGLAPVAPRVPMYLLCGDRDTASLKAVKDAQPIVERHQRSKVSYFDTPLHGERLVRFYPKVSGVVTKFLDEPVKGRVLEWEPRYLFTPIGYKSEGTVESKTTTKVTDEAKKAEETKKAADEVKKKNEAK